MMTQGSDHSLVAAPLCRRCLCSRVALSTRGCRDGANRFTLGPRVDRATRLHRSPPAWIKSFAGFIFLWVAGSVWPLSQSDILLQVPFEDTADAKIAAGNPKALVQGKAEFAEGKIGKGYLAGRQGDELLYEAKDNIHLAAGTVALWVKPLQWGEKDQFMRFWFRAGEAADAGGKGSGTFLWLYKYLSTSPLYWLLQQNYRQTATTVVGKPEGVYAPGQWTHLAASWCGPVMRLYVNGKYEGYARADTPTLMRNFGAHLYVGGASWMTNGEVAKTPESVLDEFYVFGRPLASEEIRRLCEQGPAAFTSGGVTPAEAETATAFFPSDERLKVNLMVNGRVPGDLAGLSAVLGIEDASGKPTAITNVAREVRSVDTDEWLDVKPLAPGKYRVSAALKMGATAMPPAYADFEKPAKPEWLGNTIGDPVTVPAPWTPLVSQDGTLKCWGRTVVYRHSLFPSRMTSQGKPLLTRPIVLVAAKNGRRLPVKDVHFTWGKATPLRAEFTARGKLGDLPVEVAGYMDFDGFIWTQLTLPKAAGATLEGLRLEIPLRADIATLQHGTIGQWAQEPKNGKVFAWNCAMKGSPLIWLGDEEVGLQWAAEDDYDWENADADKTIQLIPGEKECLLKITLIDHPVPLDRVREYRFGLHPTPVKPLPKEARSYDLGMNVWWHDLVAPPPKKSSVRGWGIWFQIWNLPNKATTWMMGYPVPGPYAWQAIDNAHAQSTLPFPYWDVPQLWRGIPEYAAFRTEWDPKNPPSLPFDTAPSVMGNARRTVPSFRDWAVWRLHRTLTDYPWLAPRIKGFYLDVVQGFWGADPKTDAQGTVRTRHEWLGTRELQKRLYVMLQNGWPNLLLLNHQSSDTHLPQLAFAHAYITGENYLGNERLGKEAGYDHVLDFDGCRAELASAKWGVPIIFLPEIASCGVPAEKVYGLEGIPHAEHLAGLLLAHDVIPWSALVNPVPFARLAAIKERFGWDEKTDFIGYWRKDSPLKLETAAAPLVGSVYRRPGKALLVIMNNSDQDAEVTATVDWKNLGIAAPAEVVDAYTITGVPAGPMDMRLANEGKVGITEPKTFLTPVKVPVRNGKLACAVKKRNFRILCAE